MKIAEGSAQTAAIAIKASPAVSEATPLPVPIAEEREIQGVGEATPDWGWSGVIGGSLVVVLLVGVAMIWRFRTR